LSAQSLWVDWHRDKVVALEILKSQFEGGDPTTFTTAAYFLTLRYPIGKSIVLVAELPFSHYDLEVDFEVDKPSNTLGNPYAGFEFYSLDARFFAEIGLRAPVIEDDEPTVYFSRLTEMVERHEAFLSELSLVNVILNYRHTSLGGLTFRLRFGPIWWIGAHENRGRARENVRVSTIYSVQTGYVSNKFEFLSGFSGRELTVHQFGLAATVTVGRLRPGLQIRLPLSESFSTNLDAVYGFHLGIVFK